MTFDFLGKDESNGQLEPMDDGRHGAALVIRGPLSAHHGRQVVVLLGDRKRVARERILLDLFDVAVYAVGQRKNRRDADNANRICKGRHGRTALFGHKVAGRKPQRRHKAHRGFARRPSLAARGVSDIEWIGIICDLAVRQVDDARGVNDKRDDIKEAIVAEYGEELVNRALRYCDDFVAPGLDAPEEELREAEAINEAVKWWPHPFSGVLTPTFGTQPQQTATSVY